MKQVIIATITLVAGIGTVAFFLTRSLKRTHKRGMTFAELYEDNLCSGNELFD